jgi:hypothetical protein
MFPNNFPNNNCNQYPFQFYQQIQGNENPNQQYVSQPQLDQQASQFSQQMSMPTYYYQYPAMQNYPLMMQNYPLMGQNPGYQSYPTFQQSVPLQLNPNPQPVVPPSST